MFESAELEHRLSKADYEAREPGLRSDLLKAQFEILEKARFPVLILINGIDGAGKSEAVNLLHEWMDPRHIRAHAFDAPSDAERERPFMWRYWQALPAKGKIGVMFGNWYTQPLRERVYGKLKKSALEQRLQEISRFESMLAAEGVLLIKFWFHLSKTGQKRRLKQLKADPLNAWRISERDEQLAKHFDEHCAVAAHILRRTSTGFAPWHVVDGSDARYRAVAVGEILLDAMRRRLALAEACPAPVQLPAPLLPSLDQRSLLSALPLREDMSKAEYEKRLPGLQARIAQALRSPAFSRKHSLIVVFEGMDAAGKGGAIRRLIPALDARQYRIVPVAAPSEEERAQPYLWRFWRQVPRRGKATIFDRSWYGRVLVERVEGFCGEADWMRAYGEINDFEDELAAAGAIILKFWLAVSPEEQLQRFKEREDLAHKRYKITAEDWRNREHWPEYQRAICDMIDRTSTEIAPWTLVGADNKYAARIKVLKTLCERLEGLRSRGR